jgi:hypothetical protein
VSSVALPPAEDRCHREDVDIPCGAQLLARLSRDQRWLTPRDIPLSARARPSARPSGHHRPPHTKPAPSEPVTETAAQPCSCFIWGFLPWRCRRLRSDSLYVLPVERHGRTAIPVPHPEPALVTTASGVHLFGRGRAGARPGRSAPGQVSALIVFAHNDRLCLSSSLTDLLTMRKRKRPLKTRMQPCSNDRHRTVVAVVRRV